MSQFDQQKQQAQEPKTEQNKVQLQQDSLQDPILDNSKVKDQYSREIVDIAGQPSEENHNSSDSSQQESTVQDNVKFSEAKAKVFGGLRSALKNVETSESIEQGEADKHSFSKPSGRMISSSTLQILRDSIEDGDAFLSSSDVQQSQEIRTLSKNNDEILDTSMEHVKEEPVREVSLLRNTLQNSKYSSSIQVKPIHISKEQSLLWNISSGTNSLVSNSQGSAIFPSEKISEFKGSFVAGETKESTKKEKDEK